MSTPRPRLARPGHVAAWRAVKDLESLAPDLGWREATALADGLIDTLAHRSVDVATGRARPTPVPLPVGDLSGGEGPADHASCRAAAARLRAAAPQLRQAATDLQVADDTGQRPGGDGAGDGVGRPGAGSDVAWILSAAAVAEDLAELLDQVADRSRSGRRRQIDKSVVLRRLHAMHRELR